MLLSINKFRVNKPNKIYQRNYSNINRKKIKKLKQKLEATDFMTKCYNKNKFVSNFYFCSDIKQCFLNILS